MRSNKDEAKTTSAPTTSGIVILHLSDLHFGNKNRFQGRNLTEFGQQFSRAVQEAVKEQAWGRPVDIVVVSGDIAEVAKPPEFEQGHTFLKAMIGGLDLTPSRTIFIPGNHDFSWALCERVDAERKIYDYDDAEYAKHLKDTKFQFYHDFLQKFYGLTDANLALLPGRTLLDNASGAYLHDFILDDMPISFAGLNTSEHETHKNHGGELGKPQAEALIAAWLTDSYSRYLKVAIVHHNPLATPPENLQWSEEWIVKQIAEKKLNMTPDELKHYTADMAGFKGSERLKRVVHDTETHLVLHGHHHNPTAPTLWSHRGDGVAPILSVGSLGLNAEQIPTDQPLTCQLIYFQLEPESRLIAIPLEFDPNLRLHGTLEKGQFRLNPNSEASYNKPLALPTGWIGKSGAGNKSSTVQAEAETLALTRFVTYYRNHLMGLHSTYDLKNLGVLPAEMNKTNTPKLDDLYLPLRFAEKFDINNTGLGSVFDVDRLLKQFVPAARRRGKKGSQTAVQRSAPLAITGAAGSGKTTWMRYTFRRMREHSRTLPFLIELRAVAKYWMDPSTSRHQRSIEAYLENWLQETAPSFKDFGVSLHNLLGAETSWLPVLLVDGWDELGEIGAEFRDKLIGVMNQYPRLLVVTSSRPYGTGRPSSSDGFHEYSVQPLSPTEIETFTLNFYMKCYREEEPLVKKQAIAFARALQRSEDAKLLAKTPLLLTMMLFINRSKRLPDKRHQLYEECLLSLLSERPDMQTDEGAQLLAGQWCPAESGRARVQIVARLAHDLQTMHRDKKTGSEVTTTIIVTKDTAKKYLPLEWGDHQKEGFLLWLCGRAGVMVDDTQDNIWFAHLSFQEFLTAWYLNNNVVGAEAEARFHKLAVDPIWWETLLLWAALLKDNSAERAEQVLQSLLDKEHCLLVGMMLADGVGVERQMQEWREAFGRLVLHQWPDQMDRCLRAWQASRQEERREGLLKELGSIAGEAYWPAWLRLSDASGRMGGSLQLPVNHPNSVGQSPLLTLYPDREVTQKGFGGARILSGNGNLWPKYPLGLLHLWPSERRRLTVDLQGLSSLGSQKEELKAYLMQRQKVRSTPLPSHLDEHSMLVAHDVAHFLSRELGRNFDQRIDRGFGREIGLALVLDLTLPHDVKFAHAIDSAIIRGLDLGLAQTLALNLGLALDRVSDHGRDVARYLAHNLVSNRDPETSLEILHDFCLGAIFLRSLLALIPLSRARDYTSDRLPMAVLIPACLASVTRGRLGTEALAQNLSTATERGVDPLWIALARHIARLSTPEDRALLEELAAYPEKRRGELSWALQYLIRGDVLLPDGTEVTLDELCRETDIPLYPLLEEMPPELEYEEEEETTTP
ncbi:MAG: putative signal transduction protein with Nacht domain [Chthonomonadaceae bacterium]|nr:putative signal transduction protein with Nacht domain [Chthonomonadaceae bacterium]